MQKAHTTLGNYETPKNIGNVSIIRNDNKLVVLRGGQGRNHGYKKLCHNEIPGSVFQDEPKKGRVHGKMPKTTTRWRRTLKTAIHRIQGPGKSCISNKENPGSLRNPEDQERWISPKKTNVAKSGEKFSLENMVHFLSLLNNRTNGANSGTFEAVQTHKRERN